MSSCSYNVEYSAKKVQKKIEKALAKRKKGWYTGLEPHRVSFYKKTRIFAMKKQLSVEKAAFC